MKLAGAGTLPQCPSSLGPALVECAPHSVPAGYRPYGTASTSQVPALDGSWCSRMFTRQPVSPALTVTALKRDPALQREKVHAIFLARAQRDSTRIRHEYQRLPTPPRRQALETVKELPALALPPPTCKQAAAHAALACMGAEPAHYAPEFGPWPLAWVWGALGLLF